MSVIPNNIVAGTLFVKDLPDLACFTTFTELLAALPQYLGVEIPESITNVIVSNTQPDSSQTTNVWFRTSNAGNFLGIYVFSGAKWRQIYPVPGQMFRIIASGPSEYSDHPPSGFTLVTASANYTSSQKAAVVATWHAAPTAGLYDIFDVVFTGF